MFKRRNISTLEYYNYGEQNNMQTPVDFAYKVKVSDKEDNIITIEKDGALYACVKLSFNGDSGVLSLLDVAHNNSILAEVEMPNAEYIYNCRLDESKKIILFDVKSLYGDETSTIELDIESLIEVYEAGKGIEIGEKDKVTGRRPISIKLAEGENILQVSESGLSISDQITTDDELEAAISGKADIDYVEWLFEEVSSAITSIDDIIELLKAKDEQLSESISAERWQRITNDDTLLQKLNAEIQARKDGDEDIMTYINNLIVDCGLY